MAIAFRSSSANNDLAGSLTLTKPAGTVDGDVLVANIVWDDNSSPSVPTGWTAGIQFASATISSAIYYKVAASEPANWTWGAGTGISGEVAAYTGVDNTYPVMASSDAQGGSSTTDATAPSVSPSENNGMLICGFGSTATGAWTPPSGMTNRAQSTTAAPFSLLCELVLTDTSATGAKVAVSASSGDTVGAAILLNSSSGFQPPPAWLPTGIDLAGQGHVTRRRPYTDGTDTTWAGVQPDTSPDGQAAVLPAAAVIPRPRRAVNAGGTTEELFPGEENVPALVTWESKAPQIKPRLRAIVWQEQPFLPRLDIEPPESVAAWLPPCQGPQPRAAARNLPALWGDLARAYGEQYRAWLPPMPDIAPCPSRRAGGETSGPPTVVSDDESLLVFAQESECPRPRRQVRQDSWQMPSLVTHVDTAGLVAGLDQSSTRVVRGRVPVQAGQVSQHMTVMSSEVAIHGAWQVTSPVPHQSRRRPQESGGAESHIAYLATQASPGLLAWRIDSQVPTRLIARPATPGGLQAVPLHMVHDARDLSWFQAWQVPARVDVDLRHTHTASVDPRAAGLIAVSGPYFSVTCEIFVAGAMAGIVLSE